MAEITRELTGRRRSFADAEAEMRAAANSACQLDYPEWRSVIAERYGWTFDHIDCMNFDRIAMAWRHLSSKKPRVRDDADDPDARTWRAYFSEILDEEGG